MARAAMAVHTETESLVIDLSTDQTVVSTTPGMLFGIYVNTVMSAHTVAISDGSTTVVSLKASTAANTYIEYPGIRFNTSIVCNPNASSTGNITLFYRPMNIPDGLS